MIKEKIIEKEVIKNAYYISNLCLLEERKQKTF